MKTLKILSGLFLISMLAISCTRSGYPEIKNLELGLENSKKAYLGEDFHFEAEIVAENYIRKIEIGIHKEKLDAGETQAAWDHSNIILYTENLKNVLLHEHIDVPSDVATGEYHFHISVTDREGNLTEKEAHIDVVRK